MAEVFFLGSRDGGAFQDLSRDPAVLAGPHPPNLDHPLLVPLESPGWTLFFDATGASNAFGAGEVGMGGRGGHGPPGQAHAAGGGPRVVGMGTGVAQAEMGGDAPPPPPEKGVKMFELAQLNLCTPEKKKWGTTHWLFIANR